MHSIGGISEEFISDVSCNLFSLVTSFPWSLFFFFCFFPEAYATVIYLERLHWGPVKIYIFVLSLHFTGYLILELQTEDHFVLKFWRAHRGVSTKKLQVGGTNKFPFRCPQKHRVGNKTGINKDPIRFSKGQSWRFLRELMYFLLLFPSLQILAMCWSFYQIELFRTATATLCSVFAAVGWGEADGLKCIISLANLISTAAGFQGGEGFFLNWGCLDGIKW